MGCASSGHITKLKQSIFAFQYIWIASICVTLSKEAKTREITAVIAGIFGTSFFSNANTTLKQFKY